MVTVSESTDDADVEKLGAGNGDEAPKPPEEHEPWAYPMSLGEMPGRPAPPWALGIGRECRVFPRSLTRSSCGVWSRGGVVSSSRSRSISVLSNGRCVPSDSCLVSAIMS